MLLFTFPLGKGSVKRRRKSRRYALAKRNERHHGHLYKPLTAEQVNLRPRIMTGRPKHFSRNNNPPGKFMTPKQVRYKVDLITAEQERYVLNNCPGNAYMTR
jgi:hypothetical protein